MDTTSLFLRSSISRIGIASVLTLAASGLFASCNGGDDDSGMEDEITPPASLAGSWNLFLDGISCDGDSFTATALEIIEVAENDFTLLIGEVPEQFEFSAQRVDDALMAAGISTANGVTLELEPATLLVSGNGHRLSGPVTTTRTVDGMACMFTGEFEAFEVDATQTSLVRGDWEWAARTSAVSGSCTAVGEVQAFDVTLLPKRQSQFLLDLGLPSGERVQFDASISAARLNFSGTDTLANGDEIRIAPGSFLIIEAGGVAGSGELSVMMSGSEPCDYTATLTGQRPSVGMPLLPFVQDVEGTQTLVGIRPEDPSETVVLVESLDSESLGAGTTTADAARFAELVERTVPDAGGDGAVMRDGMFYTAGGDIFFVDLAQRFDVNGGRIVLPPVRVFTGNGSSIEDLSVFVDRARSTTVVVGDRANDRFLIELGVIAPTIASALLNGSTEVLGMFMDTDGQFRGMAVLTGAGNELRRISVAQSSELIATDVTAAAVSPGGAVYYARLGQLAVVDAGETVPTVLQTAAGTSYTIGRFEGERAFMTAEGTAGATILSREPGGALMALAQTSSVGAGGAAFSDLVPVGDRVVFTMNGGSGARLVMAVPKAGGMFELLVPSPEADEYDPNGAQALGATAYFSGTSSVFGLDPTGALVPEELANASLGAPLVSDEFMAPGVRNLEAITLVGATGELSVLRRAEPMNGPLTDAVMFFSASTQDAELVLAPMGSQLLFSDRDPSQAADQFAPLYWVDLLSGGAPLLVTGEAGELNLPVR